MSDLVPMPLLATKLHVPQPRHTPVARPRLFEQLNGAFAHPLTLLVAPAGFGKTTLVAQWSAQSGQSTVWLSLDRGDNDPMRFWGYVIAALEKLKAGIGQTALALLRDQAAHPPAMETIGIALINAVASLQEDFGLVLDDYHVVENEQIHRLLAFLLNHGPATMHIMILTRADPPLPLACWRARDDLLELRAADLRFTLEETAHFLLAALHLHLGLEQVAALAARTEGWIAGLQLAALTLRGLETDQIPASIASSLSSNRFVLDYFVDEVLQGQPADVRDFLYQTAVLDRFCPALCDAVLDHSAISRQGDSDPSDERAAGSSNSRTMLDYLEHNNLFLIPLDAEGRWYRYHNLFGDILRKLLSQRHPDLVTQLHARASAWYEEHNLAPEAIEQALSAADYERAAGLIERSGAEIVNRGEVTTVLGWLKALPQEIVRGLPQLCLYYAFAQIIGGDLDAVEPWLLEAQAADTAARPPADCGSLAGQSAALQAFFAARSGDTDRAIQLTGQALACLPATHVFLRSITSWARSLAYEQAGDPAGVRLAFADNPGTGQIAINSPVAAVTLYTLGFLEMERGRLGQAREFYRRAFQALNERDQGDNTLAGLVALGMGEVLRQQDDLAGAQDYLDYGLGLSQRWRRPDAAMRGYVSLAWLYQAQGDEARSLATVTRAMNMAADRVAPETLAWLQAQQAHLAVVQGHLAAAQAWAHERKLRVLQETEDPRHHFPRFLELVVWARLLLAQGRAAEALGVLDSLWQRLPERGWMESRISISVMRALAEDALGDRARALATLGAALALAGPEGYVRIFLDEGLPLLLLLAEGPRTGAWHEQPLRVYGKRLLTLARSSVALPAGATSASQGQAQDYDELGLAAARLAPAGVVLALPNQQLVDPLSQRELEVLRLAANGLGNHDIADRLVISVGTVKSHIHSIFSKLGVEDRQHAIAQAATLELL